MSKRQLAIAASSSLVASLIALVCFVLGSAAGEASGRGSRLIGVGDENAKWLSELDILNLGDFGWSWAEWIHRSIMDVSGVGPSVAAGWPLLLGVLLFCISVGVTAGALVLMVMLFFTWLRQPQHPMWETRVIVGLSVFVFVTGPLAGLARLSEDVRYLDFFKRAFRNTNVEMAVSSRLLLPFGPLDWWSYLTPVALGVAVAASIRKPIRFGSLALVFVAVNLQLLVMFAVALPYIKLTSVMGYFPKTYPTGPLIANLTLIMTSVILAIRAVWKLRQSNEK